MYKITFKFILHFGVFFLSLNISSSRNLKEIVSPLAEGGRYTCFDAINKKKL